MALRLRRDVQKASYYVWFLGAEEAKGLRGEHVINSVLPYLISRSRNMEPLKVTLQVSHKGIKIVQGSSKHLIPHSAITSSLQSDDIVACVLLLYNPATKCPLHVHGYRCDSETTAQALNQQLQILINRTENQKRFEELENRLGIMPSVIANSKSSAHHGHKAHYPLQRHHHELSPKRFSSSLGSDTGHSTRESECSEEHNGNSPISRSPPHIGPKSIIPNANHNNQHGHNNHINNTNNNIIPNQGNELFDSLAAELRAKLNGNGPPILLPPRDYDTVHRSKGNLTAIELRRCRNSLIVGNTTPTIIENPPTKGNSVSQQTPTNANGKQVSSRGSSGIGSDLAPSPERQDLNSSSEDEHWSNEADSSVIALKPSQIPLDRSPPIISHHVSQLQRKMTKIPTPEDSYLRDLPAKPYNPRPSNRDNSTTDKIMPMGEPLRAKLSSKSSPWSKEDEIKPIIVRPTDYDAKFNRLIQAEREQKQQDHREKTRDPKSVSRELETERKFTKLNSTKKYNEINHMLNKKLSLDCESPTPRDNERHELEDGSVESDHSTGEQLVMSVGYRSENMTDKQKFLEYSAKKSGDSREKAHKYGARQRYVDPAELPFEKANPLPMPGPYKYAAAHRMVPIAANSSEKICMEREGRTPERSRHHAINEPERRGNSREKSRERYSRSNERNPYRESESLPYIESMEKMIKSSAMRYKSYDGKEAPPTKEDNPQKTNARTGSSTKSFKNDDLEERKSFKTLERSHEYAPNRVTGAKDRFKDAKEKFCAIEERVGRQYDMNDGKEYKAPTRNHDSTAYVENSPRGRRYADWSDEDQLEVETPPPSPPVRSHSHSREQWEREREIIAQTRNQRHQFAPQTRDMHIKAKPQGHVMRGDYRAENENYQRYAHPPNGNYTRSRSRDGHSPVATDRRPMRNERDYSPVMERSHGGERRVYEKQRLGHMYSAEMYPSQVTQPTSNGPNSMASAKSLSNLNKGYRHSYAEPVFGRSAGRVGLAAVNPY